MYPYIKNDKQRTGELTVTIHGVVQYHGILDIPSTLALQHEMTRYLV